MTEKCKKSLSRVFKLCDLDNDGCLSDAELSLFQRRCGGGKDNHGSLRTWKGNLDIF